MQIEFLHLDYHGIRVIMNPQFQELGNQFLETIEFQNLLQKIPKNTIIALGGDGTFLETVHIYPSSPILGIHFGTRGFLMQKKDELLSTSQFRIERFPLLDINIQGNIYGACVNEIVIKGTAGHVIEYHVTINDDVFSVRADGCIFSTALGSTGYSSSLGGPILMHNDACVFIPIASLSPRQMNPIVFSIDSRIRIDIDKKRQTEISIYRDGGEIFRGSSLDVGPLDISLSHIRGSMLVPEGDMKYQKISTFFSL